VTMSKTDDNKKITAEKIIELMEGGTIPWRQVWKRDATQSMGMLPFNFSTGRTYTGSNVLSLIVQQHIHGFASNAWLTYKQARELGGFVRKGQSATPVPFVLQVKDKITGEVVLDRNGVPKILPMTWSVFNVDQCDGLPLREELELKPVQWRHARAEELLATCGVEIRHDGGNNAYYNVATDRIHLPVRELFHSQSGYLSTAIHEIGHASGHPSRMDRPMKGRFGTPEYALEELNAEIFSMLVQDRLGLEMDAQFDPGNHIAYLQSWITALKGDHNLIFQAFSTAEKIATFYNIERLSREPMIERDLEITGVEPGLVEQSREGRSQQQAILS